MTIAIIGAGAAGCFCAVEIKRHRPDSRVVVFEAGARPMQKLALTGGGRCNITNTFRAISSLAEAYPRGERLMRRAIKVFGPEDTLRWFEAEGVEFVTQSDECVFPRSQDAGQIVGVLERAMRLAGVELRCSESVTSIEKSEGGGFELRLRCTSAPNGLTSVFLSDKVVLTIGGNSSERLSRLLPSEVLITPTAPSLFTLKLSDDALKALMGTVVEGAVLSLAGTRFRSEGTLLLTDWGVSGPATLKLSSYAALYLKEKEYRGTLLVSWLGLSEEQTRERLKVLSQGQRMLVNTRPSGLTERLWQHILQRAGLRSDLRWAEIGSKGLNRLVSRLCDDEYDIVGRAKFKEEFVTCGGVDLSGVNLSTLESRGVPGLYFAGECLDVDAITGGFNLQAAWSMSELVARALT